MRGLDEEFELYKKQNKTDDLTYEYVEVAKRKEDRSKKSKKDKSKARKAKAIAFALTFTIIGYSAANVVDVVKPYVSGAVEYSKIHSEMSFLQEDFSKTKEGYLLGLEIKYEQPDSFLEEVTEIDMNNEENIYYNPNTGNKEGTLVDYYKNLDEYVKSKDSQSRGYFQMVQRQNELLDLFGMKPADFIYTQAELEKILANQENVSSLGGK